MRDNSEMHIAPAIATLFCGDYDSFSGQPARCYLHPPGITRIGAILPTLERLATNGPSPFVAIVLLNLLEVSPQPSHLPLTVAAVAAWLEVYPNEAVFWVTNEFGLRICKVIERASQSGQVGITPDIRAQLDVVLPLLVRVGVSEAAVLERMLLT